MCRMSLEQTFPSLIDSFTNGGRRSNRTAIDLSVRVCAPGGLESSGRGHDIAVAGLAVYVPLELEIGTEIQVTFKLPYSRVDFELTAIVRNRQGFRYGVEFQRVTDPQKFEIGRVARILELTGKTH